MKYFRLLLIVLSIAGCSQPEQNTIKTISFNNKPQESVRLSQFASSVDYIKLETNSNSYINKIGKCKVFGDTILIFNEISWTMSEILMFNRNGSFLGKFGTYGIGPGEIEAPRDIIRMGNSYLLWDRQYISEYDKNGNFVRKFFKAFTRGTSLFLDSGNIFLYHGPCYPGLLSEYDFKGNLIKTYKPAESEKINDSFENESIFCINREYHLFAPALDTVWNYHENQIMPKYVFSFSEGTSIQNIFQNNRNKNFPEVLNILNSTPHSSILYFLEGENYMFISYIKQKKTSTKILSQNTGNELDFNSCENDIDGGIFGTPISINDNNLITLLEPLKIKKHLDKNGTGGNTEFDTLKESIKENDNPVLMICKLKF